MKYSWLFLLPLLVGCNGSITNQFTEKDEITKTVDFPGAKMLEVATFNGKIHIKSDGKRTDAEVKYVLRGVGSDQEAAKADLELIECASEMKPDGVLFVEAKRKKIECKGGVDIYLTVPELLVLQLNTGNGSIEVEGPVKDTTGKTSNGFIKLKRAMGNIDLNTGNGSINLVQCSGDVKLVTSNGGIDIHLDDKSKVHAKTYQGAINFAGDFVAGEHSMETSNGSITVRSAADKRLKFVTKANNGKVTNTLPPNNKGGEVHATIKLTTSNGGISIVPG